MVSKDPTINARMYDICIGTTAAPVYLPGHEFINDGRDFNLIDGGVAANNPTAVALEEVTRDVMKDFKDHEGKRHPYGQFLVLSLGTGAHNIEGKYDVKESSTWGVWGWVALHGSPLIQIFTHASTELVDYRMNNVFDILGCPDNFLRIQDDKLTEDLASLDKATKKHLENLIDVGQKLLDKPVCRPNSETGDFEPAVGLEIKNREALRKFAKRLSEERKKRDPKDLSDLATKKESVIRLLKQNMGIHD
nr:patatin-like protein 2 [Tanacetum cinerariifolium]